MSDFESPSATTTQEANTPENRATTLFAQGLIELLQPLVVDCEAKVQNVTQSQVNLSTKIDHLSEELQSFVTVAQTPVLTPYIQKLATAKSRLNNINSSLIVINDRLDRLQVTVNQHKK
eukprot:TRINITY_DN918_c0_g1_i2.p1 TRINITY_DN918_c0_g1~~TRINITY_DN918_c0_g1_i2.p1  ORF type:complete len:119 (-),score=23.22 TRINITY_DN918_c0_g1_i2:39-395(-)